jgi:hypothetical protein
MTSAMRLRAWVSGIVIALSAAACGPAPSNLPSYSFGDLGGADALLEGELVIEDGCTWIEDAASGTRYLAVWPEGSQLRGEGGAEVVRSAESVILGRAGATSEFLGGEYRDGSFVRSVLVTPIPDRCVSDIWWLVRAPT